MKCERNTKDNFYFITEERLKTLEEEKEELKEYQRWDKQRRCLEYTIHERELKENKRKLEELEESRANSGAEQARLGAEAKTAQEMVRAATKRLKEAKKEVQSAKEERDTLRYTLFLVSFRILFRQYP